MMSDLGGCRHQGATSELILANFLIFTCFSQFSSPHRENGDLYESANANSNVLFSIASNFALPI